VGVLDDDDDDNDDMMYHTLSVVFMGVRLCLSN
jgi:hypothetical protein